MYIINIFLPTDCYFNSSASYLYGDVVEIKGQQTSFYIVAFKPEKFNDRFSKYIGQITEARITPVIHCSSNKNLVHFICNGTNSNILLTNLTIDSGKNPYAYNVHIILYHQDGFMYLSRNLNNLEGYNIADNIAHLSNLLNKQNVHTDVRSATYNRILSTTKTASNFICYLWLHVSPLLNPIISKTAVAKHFGNWYEYIENISVKREKSCAIALDISAGMFIMMWLFYLGHPSNYLINSIETVVDGLLELLHFLKGNPVGFKLNEQLNNFLLECFTYHIDLWATFLVIVTPAVQYLFIPLAVLGCFGLSFQLAMLSDLLVIISLHAHCFYIYAAVLYHVEIVGIKALWRVLRGRRLNVLNGRIESHDYTNPQLYLATMFFTALLFFLPTVFIYFLVFASLRFCLYCITYILVLVQNKILKFPIYTFVCWILGTYVNSSSIDVTFPDIDRIKTKAFQTSVTVLQLTPTLSMPWISSINNSDSNKSNVLPSIPNFFTSLVKSEIMGFIQPKHKIT